MLVHRTRRLRSTGADVAGERMRAQHAAVRQAVVLARHLEVRVRAGDPYDVDAAMTSAARPLPIAVIRLIFIEPFSLLCPPVRYPRSPE